MELKNPKRFLVTTADERSWKFDRPVLFLGEWCRLYDRRDVWGQMDAVVAEPYGLRPGQKARDLSYVQALSNQLLTELAAALNSFHETRHSVRYWQIVLGHWLQRYVAVIFNRYFTLEQALSGYELSGTTVFDSVDYSLATVDSMTFIWACGDDVWDHVLCSRILSYLGRERISIETDAESLRGVGGFSPPPGNPGALGGVSAKRFILNAANKVIPELSRKHDAFIINSYLPLKEEIKLQLALGQFPQLWRSPLLKTVAPVMEERRRLEIDSGSHNGFERFVRDQLPEIIPSCYLEGYKQLLQQVESLPWPAKPKFIFTSNKFDTDEIFKAWAGSKVEKGVPYFIGQHGNNYGTLLGSQSWPEFATCDKFLTWGWTSESSKCLPAFIYKIANLKPQRWNQEGGLLLTELHSPLRLDTEDACFNFGIYQEEQFVFVDTLPEAIQKKLTVRLHPGFRKLRWSDEQRWKDRSPHTRIEASRESIQNLIAQSRLVVHSYDSTGVLETLTQNIPTLCFWQGGLGHLQDSAKPYYELLRQAGILLDSPQSAARKVAEVWDNVADWWGGEQVQGARKAFCERYARVSPRPVSELKQILSLPAAKA